jgi:hypothetical protein
MKKIIVAGLILLVLAGCSTGLSEADQQTFLQTAVAQTLEAQVTPTPTIDTSAIEELEYLTTMGDSEGLALSHLERQLEYMGLWAPGDGYNYYAQKAVDECNAGADALFKTTTLTPPRQV